MEGVRYLIRNNDLYLEYHAIFRWLPNFVFNYSFMLPANEQNYLCDYFWHNLSRFLSLSLSSFVYHVSIFTITRFCFSGSYDITQVWSAVCLQSNICLLEKIERVKRGADTCSEFSVAGLIIKTRLGRARAIGFVWAESRWGKKRKRETWRENRWYKNGDPYIPAMYGATWPYKGV